MKSSKLQEHLHCVHPGNADDALAVFEAKRSRYAAKGKTTTRGFVPHQKPALEASYCLALRIAKTKIPHTIAETLIKPCAMDMVEVMCGQEVLQKINQIPLSNHTNHDRIRDMSEDILNQVVEQIRISPAKLVSNWMNQQIFHSVVNFLFLQGMFLLKASKKNFFL